MCSSDLKQISAASVRFAVNDGVQYLSVRDLIRVMCEKDAVAASQVWLRDRGKKRYHHFVKTSNFLVPARKNSL